MSQIPNSNMLDELLSVSANICGGGSCTAEKFIVAVLRTLLGMTKLNFTRAEGSEITSLLSSVFSSTPDQFPRILDFIEDRIMAKEPDGFVDAIYTQLRISDAKRCASDAGHDELTTFQLLKSIFDAPNDFISGCINDIRSQRQSAPASSPEVREAEAYEPQTQQPTTVEPVRASNDLKYEIAKLTDRVKKMHEVLLGSVFGQDNAVSVFASGYFQAELAAMTDGKRDKPKATFLFAGPPGVGKTFLAQKAAEVLELPFMRFDMSEYCDKESSIEFCGSDKVYKDAKEGNFTGFVSKNPKCVLLLDEIEKAHISIIHLFLQILDAGRIRDNFTDEELSLSDAILIFTTNAGKQLYSQSETGNFSNLSRKVILSALRKDTHEDTGTPLFPEALCSRFASGNIVMFNHMTAHHLRSIAKREVSRQATNIEREIGISITIDESVYTALLFAEGGTPDARTITSRASSFFDQELFELFRLIGASENIAKINSIRFSVNLPENDPEIHSLFVMDENAPNNILVFASEENVHRFDRFIPGDCVFGAHTMEQATLILQEEDITSVFIDVSLGKAPSPYLNSGDIDSVSRDFMWYVVQNHSNLPIYILETTEPALTPEERLSYTRIGARDFVKLTDNSEDFAQRIGEIREYLHQQNSVISLAKANKVLTFETAQTISDDGETAEIMLFDFETMTAIDSEDAKNVLSNVSKPNVRFDDVIGAEDAKKELRYFVDFLRAPKKFLRSGAKPPKGVLLYGPPGTGKTMLAKAMACESNATFIVSEGNQFLQKYVGVGKDMVHELFQTARKYAPSILFIDEIDAIAMERTGNDGSAASHTGDILTAFLAEMDGFKNDPSKPVFVLAATNFDVEPGSSKSLDAALMRRFDRRIYIDLPTKDERITYITKMTSGNKAFVVSKPAIENIAIRSTGMSLANLESAMDLALRSAIRDGSLKVTDAVFEEAFEIFNNGEEKKWDASELLRTARHEAGHAFLCWQSGETPSYVTIVARGNHGGYMQHGDNESKGNYTRNDLLARIRTSLGGRASELVYYGTQDGVSAGASSDLIQATNIAKNIICSYGMDDDFGLAVIDERSMQSGEMALEVRRGINRILSAEMEKAIQLISQNWAAIDALVDVLMSQNHLRGEQIDSIFNTSAVTPRESKKRSR